MMQVLLLAALCGGACPDTTTRAVAAVQERVPLEVEVAHTREVLTGGRGEWTESVVRVTHRQAPDRLVFAQGRVLTRFDRGDGDLSVGTVIPVAPGWTASVDAGWSPSPVFLPSWNAGGIVSHAPGGGWVVGYGLRHLEYATGPVLAQQGIAEFYTGPWLLGYTLGHAHVRDAGGGVTHTGRGTRFYGAGSSATAGLTRGRGVETVAPGDVRLLDLQSVALWGVHWVDAGTGITWSAGWHRHGDLFQRSGVSVGVRQRL